MSGRGWSSSSPDSGWQASSAHPNIQLSSLPQTLAGLPLSCCLWMLGVLKDLPCSPSPKHPALTTSHCPRFMLFSTKPEEHKAQRGQETCPRSPSKQVSQWGVECEPSDPAKGREREGEKLQACVRIQKAKAEGCPA